ncbi:uncharacterized protein ACRADG_006218 isoform 1-T3 [Cochliomyia hominivorax]
MSQLIKNNNNNNKKSLSLSSTIATKTTKNSATAAVTDFDPNRPRAAITLHKYPIIKAASRTTTTNSKLSSATTLLSPSSSSAGAATSNVDVVSSFSFISSTSSTTAATAEISLMEHNNNNKPVELTDVTSGGSGRKVIRTMPSFKIMSYQNFIALLTVLVCGLVTVNGLKCYMCGQYNEGVGSITPCLNYSEQYAHLYLKECSKKSEKYCVKYVSELSIVRDCATECAEKEIWETQTYCCTEDGCNGSNNIEASTVAIMLPLFIYIVNEVMNIINKQRR